MSETKKFRSALNGFNRQDVVQYIEYMSNRHSAQVQQLNTQLQTAREKPEKELAALREENAALHEQLAAKEEELCALTEQLAAKEEALRALTVQLEATEEAPVPPMAAPAPAIPTSTEQELEAYRRAERAERLATERARAIYDRANAILADVTLQADEYARATDAAFSQLVSAMDSYKAALALNRPKLDEAARTLSTIRISE